MADLKEHAPQQDAMQLSRVLALQKIEQVFQELTPLQKEALALREQGLSDDEAGRASMRPCSGAAFRQRVHDARLRARQLAAHEDYPHSECETDKEMP
jgi:DNA-directed RNA polymerase specialized sigma24 family protein